MKKGFTLVEVLIASAIIMGAVLSLLATHSLYVKVALGNANTIKASYLAEEVVEVLRFWRSASWSSNIATLTNGTSYGLVLNGSTWQASTTSKYVGDIERSFSLGAVYRDANQDIVTSGGTLDTGTKLVTVTVAWPRNGATTTKTLQTYITNLWQN